MAAIAENLANTVEAIKGLDARVRAMKGEAKKIQEHAVAQQDELATAQGCIGNGEEYKASSIKALPQLVPSPQTPEGVWGEGCSDSTRSKTRFL